MNEDFRRLVEALQASYADVAARAAEYEGENSFRGGFFVGKHAAYREILELLNSLQGSDPGDEPGIQLWNKIP